jgi:hypothetical protein
MAGADRSLADGKSVENNGRLLFAKEMQVWKSCGRAGINC